MSFDTRAGTRGARQPGGRLLRWFNRFNARRIRRRGGGKFRGGDALVLRTIRRKSGAERAEAWERITKAAPGFAEYQKQTDRVLPVIRLVERR